MHDPLPLNVTDMMAALLAEQRTNDMLRERLNQRDLEYRRLRRWINVASCKTCRARQEALKQEPVNSVPDVLEPETVDRSPRQLKIDLD